MIFAMVDTVKEQARKGRGAISNQSGRYEPEQRVTVDDVKRVAGKYLRPDDLTIVIFGTPADEERKRLGETFALTELKTEDVFTGGYDESAEEESEASSR